MKNSLKNLLLPLLVILTVLPGCKHWVSQSQVQVPSATPISKGHELFLAHCASCHQGTGNPPGPNAVILDSETLKSQTDFTALLRQPRSSMMTTFGPDKLPDTDIKELYKYILIVKNPQAPQ